MTVGGAGTDVLETGRQRRQVRPRWIGILIVACLTIGGAGWWWQHQDAVKHYDALLTCVARAETAIRDSQSRIQSAISTMTTGIESGLDPNDRLRLFAPVARSARASTPAVQTARRNCEIAQLRPWAPEQRTARDAYLRYLDSELQVLGRSAADGQRAFANHSETDQAHVIAADALQRQAPSAGLRQRARSLTVRG